MHLKPNFQKKGYRACNLLSLIKEKNTEIVLRTWLIDNDYYANTTFFT